MTKIEQLDNAVIAAEEYQAPGAEPKRESFKITAAHIVLFVAAIVALVFIAFITMARSIEVRAITADLSDSAQFYTHPADINIETSLKLPLGNRVLVLPGSHRVAVSAEGYTPIEQELTVGEDRHQLFELVITRLPGKLEIQLSDQTAATVLVDGQTFAELPGTVNDVPAGRRQITVDAPLFRPQTQNVLVRGKGETQSISMTLEPAWAEYSFSSEPAGATVQVDDVDLGATPLTVKLEEGTRKLQIEAPLFKPFAQEIGVVAGENLTIPSIQLVPADGIIEVTSTPTGAAVVLNSKYQGTTPIKMTVPPGADKQLRVYKAGYRLSDSQISLTAEQVLNKNLVLQQDLISVQVSVSPDDAQVFVDGQPRGRGSQTLSLNTLPHNISVRKAGYVTQNNQIIPTRRSQQIVRVNLLTEEEHYWAQIPNSYVTKQGQEMKLFRELGKVKMGSSRREDGRRANEAVFEAKLTKPFYVALHETTNKQFRAFKKTHNAGNYKKKSLDANRAPAVNMTWQEAALYCNWLSKGEGLDPFYQTTSGFVSGNNEDANGYRLLTEAEWAWLARNQDDGSVLTYPWGFSKQPPVEPVDNFADIKAVDLLTFTLADYDDGYRGPSPVGRFPANHRGLFDLGGNASEWVNDWYSAKGSSEFSGAQLENPLGPDIGEFHVVRGASWAKGYLPTLRLAYRDYGAKGKHDIGFRIARYAGLNKKK